MDQERHDSNARDIRDPSIRTEFARLALELPDVQGRVLRHLILTDEEEGAALHVKALAERFYGNPRQYSAFTKHCRALGPALAKYYRNLPEDAPNRHMILLGAEHGGADAYRPTIKLRTNHVGRFWAPYFQPRETQLVFGLPLFWHSPEKNDDIFLRRVSVNAVEDAPDDLKDHAATFRYMARGDAMAGMTCTEFFARRNVPLHRRAVKSGEGLGEMWNDKTEDANVVVFGSPRSNGVLDGYQTARDLRWRGGPRDALILPFQMHDPENQLDDADTRSAGPHVRDVVRVLVTRRLGVTGGVITMIASHDALGIDRVCQALTREDLFRDAVHDARRRGVPMPTTDPGDPDLATAPVRFEGTFQLLFYVGVTEDHKDVGGKPWIMKAWFESEGRAM